MMADENFQEAIAKVRDKYTKNWLGSLPEELSKRETAYSMLRALADVVTEIRIVIGSGQMSQVRIDRAKKRG